MIPRMLSLLDTD